MCKILFKEILYLNEKIVFFLELNGEQKQLQDAVRKFTKEEIIPVASHYDQTMEYPWPIIKKAHENGFINVDVGTEYGINFKYIFILLFNLLGGLDLDLVSNVVISEAIGYGCTGIGTAIMANDLASSPLILCANDDIKKRFLTRLIEEPLMAVSI